MGRQHGRRSVMGSARGFLLPDAAPDQAWSRRSLFSGWDLPVRLTQQQGYQP